MSLLLPYAPTGLSLIAGWCLIGATPRGQPRTPVLCTFCSPFMGRPMPRQLMRNELLDLTTIVPATTYHHRSYAERYSRSREAWGYCIGGYQVLDRYLKARKGRKLNLDEIENIQSVVKVLLFTTQQMQKIEAAWKP